MVPEIIARFVDPAWRRADADFFCTPVGSRIRRSFWHEGQSIVSEDILRPGENLLELIGLLEAVAAARDTFTMVELGAGHGRWVVAGALAAQKRRLKSILVAVEAERGHFEMLRQHFIDNDIDPDDHTLIKAAVTADGNSAYFTHGHSREWWGQTILPTPDYGFGDWPQATVERVDGVSLSEILVPLEKIDYIDMDIQGAEFDVLASAKAVLSKVGRVHIGTHGREIEHSLAALFGELGWTCRWRFACGSTQDTEYGRVTFQDGIQSWINPHLWDPLEC